MRKRKTSKYVGKEFAGGWVCTGINVAKTSLSHKNGGPSYWYAFERVTGDGKFRKWVRVADYDAAKIWKGLLTVDELEDKKKQGIYKANYRFIDER